MLKTTKQSKVISILLTLCMVLGLMPLKSFMAFAQNTEDGNSWVGNTRFDYADAEASGDGWQWDGETHTLTLSGVNITSASEYTNPGYPSEIFYAGVLIFGDATVVLQGANRIFMSDDKSRGLVTEGNLVINGSGTLDSTADANAVFAGDIVTDEGDLVRDITIESGYINAVSTNGYNTVYADNMYINGGYLNVSSTAEGSSAVYAPRSYQQTAGYVKAAGVGDGMQCGTFNITGGYLEASGKNGISGGYESTITNNGGVIKAIGSGDGSTGIEVRYEGKAVFNSGVTIAAGKEAAVDLSDIDVSAEGTEKYWKNTSGAVSGSGAPVSDVTGTSVVIAKAIEYTSGDLDGHYLYSNSTAESTLAAADITVSGGSYLENNGYFGGVHALEATGEVTADATLVCMNPAAGSGYGIKASVIDVNAGATLIAGAANGRAVNLLSGTLSNSGCTIAISESPIYQALYSTAITVDGGYLCAKGASSGMFLTGGSLTVGGGYVTAVGGGTQPAFKLTTATEKATATDTGVITAVSDGTGAALSGTAVGEVLSSTEKYAPIAASTTLATDKVVCIKAASAPTFDLRNGTIVSERPTDPQWGSYVFAGWYTGIDGTGEELTADPVAGTTYYAKWTNNGKTVRTTQLDCTTFTQDESNEYEDWSWDNTNKALTLSGTTIDCAQKADGSYAVKLPAGTTIEVTEDNAMKGGEYTGAGSVNVAGIYGEGAITINGTGSLAATAGLGKATAFDWGNASSYGIRCTELEIKGSVSVNATGGDASSTSSSGTSAGVGIGGATGTAVTVSGGSLNVSGSTATGMGGNGNSYGVNGSLTVTGGTATASGNTQAIWKTLTATGAAIKAGADSTGTDTIYTAQKWVNVSFGPSITITSDDDLSTDYNKSATKTLKVKFENFENAPSYCNIRWCNAEGTTAGVNNNTGSLSLGIVANGEAEGVIVYTSYNANAGDYYVYVSVMDGNNRVNSAPIKFTVNKLNADDTMKTVTGNVSNKGKENVEITLPTLPTGASYGTPTTGGTITMTSMSINGSKLTYTAPASTAGQTGTITIPVTGATNYSNYNITVTITSIDKTPVTITGAESATGLIYNGTEQKGYTGVATVTDHTDLDATLVYYYEGTGTTNYTKALTAPTNAGTYKAVISVPEDNETYTGSLEIPFAISKKAVTVKPKAVSIYTGGTPTFELDYTGVVAEDAAKSEFQTLLGACTFAAFEIGDTLAPITSFTTAKSYDILWTNMDAVQAGVSAWNEYNNYTVTWENKNTLTISIKSSGGGGSSVSYYTVTYNTNGGNKITSTRATRNTAISEPTTPTKDGYTFDGWYTDSKLTTKYDFTAKVTKSITLYAKWTEKPVDNSKNEIVLTIGKKDATVFGESKANDVAPIIRNDRTMLPARFVAESLGAKVEWDEAAPGIITITKDDITIVIRIGEKFATLNGEQVELDNPAFIENDRTYTPIRFISEKLGATVDWNEAEQKVTITRK